VWVHDPDLQQVTVRAMDKALGSTPMALLTGQDFEKDFDVKAQNKPDAESIAWVIATPRTKEGSVFESMRMGFKGKSLVAVDILDALGQRTLLRFDNLVVGHVFAPEHFNFKVPSGTDVLNQ
jgi:outer membrane lipoprotein carrier protein